MAAIWHYIWKHARNSKGNARLKDFFDDTTPSIKEEAQLAVKTTDQDEFIMLAVIRNIIPENKRGLA